MKCLVCNEIMYYSDDDLYSCWCPNFVSLVPFGKLSHFYSVYLYTDNPGWRIIIDPYLLHWDINENNIAVKNLLRMTDNPIKIINDVHLEDIPRIYQKFKKLQVFL